MLDGQVHLQVGEPEYIGKLNFHVTAVNKQLTGDGDNPAIGLLICKDKDNVVAEYSLEEVSQPIGIAGYELRNALRKEYQSSLPTIEASVFSRVSGDFNNKI